MRWQLRETFEIQPQDYTFIDLEQIMSRREAEDFINDDKCRPELYAQHVTNLHRTDLIMYMSSTYMTGVHYSFIIGGVWYYVTVGNVWIKDMITDTKHNVYEVVFGISGVPLGKEMGYNVPFSVGKYVINIVAHFLQWKAKPIYFSGIKGKKDLVLNVNRRNRIYVKALSKYYRSTPVKAMTLKSLVAKEYGEEGYIVYPK